MSQAVSYEDGGQQLATYLGSLCYVCFLNIRISCYKPLLRTTFSVSVRFWCVVCPFSFLSQYYLSSLFDFFFDPLDFQECVVQFQCMLFSFNMSVYFPTFPLNGDFQFHTIVIREDTWFDINSSKLFYDIFAQSQDLTWRLFHVHLRIMRILLLLDDYAHMCNVYMMYI